MVGMVFLSMRRESKIIMDFFCFPLGLHYFDLRSKIGFGSEKLKYIWFFTHLALSLPTKPQNTKHV